MTMSMNNGLHSSRLYFLLCTSTAETSWCIHDQLQYSSTVVMTSQVNSRPHCAIAARVSPHNHKRRCKDTFGRTGCCLRGLCKLF